LLPPGLGAATSSITNAYLGRIPHNATMQDIRITPFPVDGQPWRLDWLGDVFYRRQYRYTQPFIRVALSKVSLDPSGSWSYPISLRDWQEQFHASVPVSTLVDLRIGTIWQNGSMVSDPGYMHETFPITANKDTTTLIKAGVANAEKVFILPFEAHPFHKAHTHSYCLQISLAEETRLIIPVPELIRFYFGSSSTFLGRLFQGPFQEERFWTRAEFHKNGVAELGLAKGIAGASAHDVARIALDPIALHAAKLISNSLMAPSGPDERAYPKTVFPFIGKTRLKVKGVWLPGVNPRTFLAFQMLSCTHRFPFKTLRYTMSKRQRPKDAGGSKDGPSGKDDVIGRSLTQGTKNSLMNEPPDSRKSAKEKRFSSASRFPDLDYKSVIRVDPVTPVRFVITDSGELSVGTAVGDAEGCTGIRPIDLVAVEDAPIPKGHPLEQSVLATYVDGVVQKLLKERKGVWFVPLDSRQRFPQFSVMPQIVNEDGVIHPLSYIEIEEKTRPRYISVLRIANAWPTNCEIWVVPEAESGQGSDALEKSRMIFTLEDGCTVDARWVALQIARSVRIQL